MSDYKTTEEGVYGFPWRPRDKHDLMCFMGVWCVQCSKYGADDAQVDCAILTDAVCDRYGLLTHTAEGHLHCPGFDPTC